MSSESQYKDTLLLPQTTFPMRGDLVDNEPKRLAIWEKQGLYQKILGRRRAQKAPTFILHDGPPFANGDVHMGTALNKVLKDLVGDPEPVRRLSLSVGPRLVDAMEGEDDRIF